ncbi:Zinc finger protein STOP1-like protein [Hibiscus syriacus]|uniref:Zinc finger protein STOP1-like protein n=1 Tax=Hibiscus syriacus TaxID=106335 RepID=A0A6A2Y5F4_HIBSY|nr:protein SENSITIVE TO PROTON RHIZOTOXICITY 1-like [Hibiscus syriacus]KAE8665727.1 Zinc finger protein STOP1-like protein [Hibiscus syriacus]
MSNPGDPFRISSESPVTRAPSLRQQALMFDAGLRVPLENLSTVKMRMDSLQDFLSQSVNTNTLISKHQMDLVSSEITASVHQIIVNGAALLSCAKKFHFPDPAPVPNPSPEPLKLKFDDYDGGDSEIIELDAVELLAEHLHFCEICGKGFKRDANLRMHMRAHGDQYKTTEALSKKSEAKNPGRSTRFSCPYDGCNRNKKHLKFRPLKSVICVRNHFKRSHCPKMYSCNGCHKKSFSVLADLKAHLKHCGADEEVKKWKCSCGDGFNRKNKLFGHISLFEGHMPVVEEEPAIVAAAENRKLKGVLTMEEDEDDLMEKEDCLEDSLFDDLLREFGSFENYSTWFQLLQ